MMTLISNARETPYDPDYGWARARDVAFDAVIRLWRLRRDAGMKQKDLADILGRKESWVSRQLSGPGNWTLKIMGQLVEALDGELEIHVYGRDEPAQNTTNHDAYSGYGNLPPPAPWINLNNKLSGGNDASEYTNVKIQRFEKPDA